MSESTCDGVDIEGIDEMRSVESDLGEGAGAGRDDRQVVLPGFEHRQPESLVEGHVREHLRRRQQPSPLVVVDVSRQPHSPACADVECRDRGSHWFGVGAVPASEHESDLGIVSGDCTEGAHETHEVLPGLERSDRQDHPRSRAGRHSATLGRAMGNCDDPVGLEERAGLDRHVLGRRVDPPTAAATRRTTGPNATTVGEQRSRAVTNEQSCTVITVCAVGGAI